MFRHFSAPELASGKVRVLLEQHATAAESFHLYYPNRDQTPAKLRVFIEFLRAVNWKVPK